MKKQVLVAVLSVVIICAGLMGRVSADVSDAAICEPIDSQPYSASLAAPANTYGVYGRLGKSTANTNVQVFQQNDTGCTHVGTAPLTFYQWQKIGTINVSSDTDNTLSLYSDSIQGLPDANRPSLMLVSESDPVCVPSSECFVTVDGQQGYIRPTGSLFNEDSLHVVRVVDPAKDTIKNVEYYVGANLVYTKPTLEPFDQRYLADDEPNISRVITYASGQKVVLPQSVETSYAKSFERRLFKTAESNALAIIASVILIASIVLMRLLLSAVRYGYARHRWKQLHIIKNTQPNKEKPSRAGVIPPNLPPTLQEPHFTRETPDWLTFGKYLLYGIGGCVILGYLLIMIGTYLLQPYQVDGVSMQSTLATGEQLVVNKTGKTWASLNRRQYIPKRGEIIVFQKPQQTVLEADPAYADQKEYVVKRVIGLPGERITVLDGVITVYNKLHPDGFNPDDNSRWSTSIHRSDTDDIDITVPEGQIFVVGDNRPESVDSRFNGPVDSKYIVGNVILRLSPFDRF